ncbi:ATP synthase subunit s, mitochondrial isoform X1 [Dermacentor variabilis]|uniref:ATP synthase subunit s, mitochondrial isoform X1 n=2 Tax=Dermacentor variabilis TaxID=34621 RepID=UPI003F5B6FFA
MAALSNVVQAAKRPSFAREAAHSQKRLFWQWLNAVFNRYDRDRIKEIGPDRAAAEWLIRCGAAVRWSGAIKFHSDYNTLPSTSSNAYKIEEIDATDSSIMEIGFPYLKELTLLKSINLTRCNFLGDKALQMLQLRKDSLEKVHVISCGNVTDAGVKSLAELTKLHYLELFDLPGVRDREAVLEHFNQLLPTCKVDFPDVNETTKPKK